MGSKSGSISLFGVLFWGALVYNCFFTGDDSDDKKVEVVADSSPVVSEQLKESFSDIKKELKESFVILKEELSKAGDELSNAGVQLKEELSAAKDEAKDAIKTDPPKEELLEIEPEPDLKEDKLKSLDDEPKPETKMKKL